MLQEHLLTQPQTAVLTGATSQKAEPDAGTRAEELQGNEVQEGCMEVTPPAEGKGKVQGVAHPAP